MPRQPAWEDEIIKPQLKFCWLKFGRIGKKTKSNRSQTRMRVVLSCTLINFHQIRAGLNFDEG
jgi:hypothetical protein